MTLFDIDNLPRASQSRASGEVAVIGIEEERLVVHLDADRLFIEIALFQMYPKGFVVLAIALNGVFEPTPDDGRDFTNIGAPIVQTSFEELWVEIHRLHMCITYPSQDLKRVVYQAGRMHYLITQMQAIFNPDNLSDIDCALFDIALTYIQEKNS